MNTSHVKPFNSTLHWSGAVDGSVLCEIFAACPNEGEFYFVKVDLDAVWAGLIIKSCAFSREVTNQEEGKVACQADFDERLKVSYKNSGFNQKVK